MARQGPGDLSEQQIAQARLIDDMLPFAYQVKSMAIHSMGALKSLPAGVFSPDMTPPDATFAGMRRKLAQAQEFLTAVSPDELEDFIGKDMRFEVGELKVPFTAENFLLSFSAPNFYFHAATSYDILRAKGVELGKRDFLGPMRAKQG